MNVHVPIFVGGLMKSGTTLVRKLIAGHPNIFGGLETHWFSQEFETNWSNPQSKRSQWLAKFYDITLKEYTDLSRTCDSHYTFINAFLLYCAGKVNKHRFVEKTPDNIIHLEEIWRFWPQAKVIHLVREPLDVFASWKKHEKGSLGDFLEKANK